LVFVGGGRRDLGDISAGATKKESFYLPVVDQRVMMSAIRWEAKPSP
jgi:hypothetical protein